MAKRKLKATTVNQTQKKEPKKNSFWEGLKFFFSSLFSNDTCVEARKKPWWTGLIIALLSCVVATLPTMVSYFSRSGSAFFDAPTNAMDTALVEFEKALSDNNVSMKIENKKLTLTVDDEAKWNSICKDNGGNQQDFYGHYYTINNVVLGEDGKAKAETKTYCDLAVYYVKADKLALVQKTIMEYASAEILAKQDPNAVLNNGVKAEDKYSTNLIVFGEDSFVAFKKPVGAETYAAAIQGKYDFGVNFDLKDLYKQNMKGVAYKSDLGTAAHRDEVMKAYSNFFAASWESTKNTIAWQYSGIAMAINAGLVLLFGLMIWLMTRGKQNPFHEFSFLDSEKIAWWSAAAPAILSLIGFMPFFANFAMFIFLFLMGMRTMWMSTRTLRPYGAQ